MMHPNPSLEPSDDLPKPVPGIGRTAMKGGCLLGAIGFIGGFVGPIILAPDSPQGPMLGIFFTGPGGFVLGLMVGAVVGFVRSRKL